MHIAFLTTEYPHSELTLKVGGIASFTKNLAVALKKKGIKVSVFLVSQTKQKIILDNGIKVHLIKEKRKKGFTWYVNRKAIERYVNRVVGKDEIDVIEAPDWGGLTAFMKFKIPLVIRLHGTDSYFCNLENRPVKFKNYYFEKMALKRANKIIGVSSFVSNKTKEIFNLKKKIYIIYNAIDVTLFYSKNTIVEKNTILYFGSIIRKKGVLELSTIFNKVVKSLPEAKLILIGKDVIDFYKHTSTLELLKNDFSVLALANFKHHTEIPYTKVKSYIAKAELVVLPSFAEAFPMTWLEAMAMEKKMVTSDIGWAKELMINENTGFTVSPKNHELYAKRIVDFLTNKKYDDLPKNARQRIIENFNQDKIVEQNIQFFKEII
jgi:glycosyltransferase involved in cell wall biosynthesis